MEGPRPAVEAVRALLDKRLRVELSDGRTVEGRLECYDDSGNMILVSTTDVTAKVALSSVRDGETHFMGTVLVPGHAPVSIKKIRFPVSLESAENPRPLLHMNELKKELETESARDLQYGNADSDEDPMGSRPATDDEIENG